MYRLRIYTDPVRLDRPVEGRVFYCQRDGGPPYRWSDEQGADQWHYTRLHPSDWKPQLLCHSRKDEMPAALQAKLNAHYL
jgi:hypothetical protein